MKSTAPVGLATDPGDTAETVPVMVKQPLIPDGLAEEVTVVWPAAVLAVKVFVLPLVPVSEIAVSIGVDGGNAMAAAGDREVRGAAGDGDAVTCGFRRQVDREAEFLRC